MKDVSKSVPWLFSTLLAVFTLNSLATPPAPPVEENCWLFKCVPSAEPVFNSVPHAIRDCLDLDINNDEEATRFGSCDCSHGNCAIVRNCLEVDSLTVTILSNSGCGTIRAISPGQACVDNAGSGNGNVITVSATANACGGEGKKTIYLYDGACPTGGGVSGNIEFVVSCSSCTGGADC